MTGSGCKSRTSDPEAHVHPNFKLTLTSRAGHICRYLPVPHTRAQKPLGHASLIPATSAVPSCPGDLWQTQHPQGVCLKEKMRRENRAVTEPSDGTVPGRESVLSVTVAEMQRQKARGPQHMWR